MSSVANLVTELNRADERAGAMVTARYDLLPPRQLVHVFEKVLSALVAKGVDIQAALDGTIDKSKLRTYSR